MKTQIVQGTSNEETIEVLKEYIRSALEMEIEEPYDFDYDDTEILIPLIGHRIMIEWPLTYKNQPFFDDMQEFLLYMVTCLLYIEYHKEEE